MPPDFRRIALIGKLRSPEIDASLRELRAFLARRGCQVLDEGETRADLAIVIGGDGTMLSAARELVRHRVPLVGINQGRLGFMTDICHQDMQRGVGAILDGNHTIEERSPLDPRSGATAPAAHDRAERGGDRRARRRLIEFELVTASFVHCAPTA
jgi:NAD+ kinase